MSVCKYLSSQTSSVKSSMNKLFCVSRTARCINSALIPYRYVSGSLYQPDYINIKRDIPVYETLNIRLRAYDYVTVESFAKYTHKTCDSLGLDANAYAVPCRTKLIQSYKANSTKPEAEYNLSVYERVVQVEELSSTLAPILIQILQMNLPAGVEMCIKPVDEEEENFRYVPDLTLQELQSQIAELDKAKDERKRK